MTLAVLAFQWIREIKFPGAKGCHSGPLTRKEGTAMHFLHRSLATIAFSAVLPMALAEGIQLKPAWPGVKVDRPITLLSPADGTGRQFLVEQRGKVRILPSDQAGKETKTFLDLSDRKMEENQFE